MKTIFLAAAALAAALPARAAEYVCAGQARGPAGEVHARLDVQDGRIARGAWSWFPPPDRDSTPTARLAIARDYADPTKGRLGPVALAVVMNVATVEDLKHEHAVVAISSNTAKAVLKPWRQFTQAAAELKGGRAPRSSQPGEPVAFVGAVPFNRQDEGAGALLDSLDTARTVITSVTDVEGKVLMSRGLFWLTDRGGAEALGEAAHRQALEAAKTPESRCKPVTAAG